MISWFKAYRFFNILLLFVFVFSLNATADTVSELHKSIDNHIDNLKVLSINKTTEIGKKDDPTLKITTFQRAFSPPNEAAMKLATESYDAARGYMLLSTMVLNIAKERLDAGDIDGAIKYIDKSNTFERIANINRESIQPLLENAQVIGVDMTVAKTLGMGAKMAAATLGPAGSVLYGVAFASETLRTEYEIEKNLAGKDRAKIETAVKAGVEAVSIALEAALLSIPKNTIAAAIKSATANSESFNVLTRAGIEVTKSIVADITQQYASDKIIDKITNPSIPTPNNTLLRTVTAQSTPMILGDSFEQKMPDLKLLPSTNNPVVVTQTPVSPILPVNQPSFQNTEEYMALEIDALTGVTQFVKRRSLLEFPEFYFTRIPPRRESLVENQTSLFWQVH